MLSKTTKVNTPFWGLRGNLVSGANPYVYIENPVKKMVWFGVSFILSQHVCVYLQNLDPNLVNKTKIISQKQIFQKLLSFRDHGQTLINSRMENTEFDHEI